MKKSYIASAYDAEKKKKVKWPEKSFCTKHRAMNFECHSCISHQSRNDTIDACIQAYNEAEKK